MQDLTHFLNALILYPKGSLLFLVAILNFFWVFYVVFARKNFTQKIYKAYFFYAIFALLWVLSNGYFQSNLLLNTGEIFALKVSIFANITCSFSIIGFYYLSCYIKNQTICKKSWALMFFIIIETLLFNLIPGLTVEGVKIFENGRFELILGME